MNLTSTFWQSVLLFTFILGTISGLNAQIDPTLSVQGILKKANGVAVDDGTYSLTFKLYTQETGGTAVWTETQPAVEVSSGIYSATLGVVSPLNVAFDQLYYLGVTVGSSELSPRILLTSAPYALSLIGQSNRFPSAGGVRADSMRVATNLVVNGNLPTTHSVVAVGGYLARGGAPGANGVSNNGYAFDGNSGDKDSGLFSTQDGKVSLYVDNAERLAATSTGVTVTGTTTTNGVNVNNNGSVSYNGLNDWRLVDVDNFDNGADGWQVYSPASGQESGWNNASAAGGAPTTNFGGFAGNVLYPSDNRQVLKKFYNIPGSFTQIKVKFRYYFIDTWDFGDDDIGFAGFSSNASGSDFRWAWKQGAIFPNANPRLDGGAFDNASHFAGDSDNGDSWQSAEMTARAPSSSFWVFIGAGLSDGTSNERYAVGGIEIWVK